MARKETMENTDGLPSRSEQQLVLLWLEKPMQRGRPSCPCGFVGTTRTILRHRGNCSTWKAYACMSKWISQWKTENAEISGSRPEH